MMSWLSRLRHKRPAPLSGAPPVRRQKTYASQTGYIYEYYYEGNRIVDRRDGNSDTEYVFNVSAGGAIPLPVSVFLGSDVVQSWEGQYGRELNATERYAVAKMTLFQAFDERANLAQMRNEIRVRLADMEVILAKLGIG